MARIGQHTAEPQGDIRGIVNKKTQESKRKRRAINLILILLFLLLLIGIGFLIYFIVFKLTTTPPKEVAVDVNFTSYSVVAEQETQIGKAQVVSFDNKESSTTKDLTFEYAIAEQSEEEFVRLEYRITNKVSTQFSYTIDFSNLIGEENTWLIGYAVYEIDPQAAQPAKPTPDDIENGTVHNLPAGKIIDYKSSKDVLICVLIKVQPTALGSDAMLSGHISFTISTVDA